MKLNEILLRDPFILPVKENGVYYLYGSPHTFVNPDGTSWSGIYCWKSADLEDWNGPIKVFEPPLGILAPSQYWAPEVHRYHGKYYMFVTFPQNQKDLHATWILKADFPEGPFHLWSDGPIRPTGWRTLDGTLFIDKNGRPWMIFCHEWVQIHQGTICAIPLTQDLKRSAGAVIELFHAYEAPWALVFDDKEQNSVTDGPFLFYEERKLKMLWSSLTENRVYAMGIAISDSGEITGPWRQCNTPLCSDDCGHGMRFLKFDGTPVIVVHQPNCGGTEHPVFLK